MSRFARAALATAAVLSTAGAMELSKENWDEAVSGKTIFVKFFAPWCGHCKSMKPDWDKLMAEYKDSPTILIADVDCTADGKDLCEEQSVEGFPTLKYGDPDDLQDYEGGRDLKSFQKFAKESLGPSCGPANLDLCDDEKKKQIAELQALGLAKLGEMVKTKEGELTKLESEFKEFVEGLQKQYEEATKTKEEGVKAVKEGGLGLAKSVLAHVKKAKSEL